ncbi:hypothetical protein PIB30_043474 [Stylosanthes scabra]|uniref:Uncharacterized protein n=1 Tax=Stylosanthes scabra TaxID=79078 RepID=A0ABU6YED7_9FABA|nr:hypothetical protein [Stylosanthes scabra]
MLHFQVPIAVYLMTQRSLVMSNFFKTVLLSDGNGSPCGRGPRVSKSALRPRPIPVMGNGDSISAEYPDIHEYPRV